MSMPMDDEPVKGEIDPPHYQRFNTTTVKSTVKAFLEEYFKVEKYDPESGEYMANQISKGVRDKLREASMPRYKIIVKVFLGENKEQRVIIIGKGFWDIYVDNYVSYVHHGTGFYCNVVVYGFYSD